MRILNKLKKKKQIDFFPSEKQIDNKNKKNLIIHHYCPHTFNAGDHFVILSIRKHLKKHLPESGFIPKAVAGNRGWGKPIGLRGENIRFSNEFADAIILGGSDQYNNWSPRIKAEEIKNLIPPLFLIGLGVSSSDLNSVPHIKNEEYRRDILATNFHSSLSSVRDFTTQNFLKEIGYNESIMTGCPALYLFDKTIQPKNGPVLLTFPYPLVRNKKRNEKYEILLNAIDHTIKTLIKHNLPITIMCHDDRDVPAAQKLFGDMNIFFSNYQQDYFDIYDNAKMIIGSRLHATILASGMG
ncbi:MAG: polysaccharide pyruvyl transferase family protein, partial [Candidatus Cloacimonetes bacterium]|nr:polysaccharide pyruvyl transferase family protein [Candidatus Cloacimonadota bacterium]